MKLLSKKRKSEQARETELFESGFGERQVPSESERGSTEEYRFLGSWSDLFHTVCIQASLRFKWSSMQALCGLAAQMSGEVPK